MTSRSTIMVIEDDADIADVLAMMLEERGHRVVLAANGRDGLDKLRAAKECPDLILLDLMMPVMDGREFRVAQRSDASLASIPVVLVSAHVDVRSIAAEMAATSWLSKPIDLRTLLDVVERPAGRSREPSSLASE